MDRPCCVGVIRDPNGLKGQIVDAEGLPTYLVAAPGSKFGLVLVHDIFGHGIPNGKFAADYFASQGVTTVFPDFYQRTGVWSESAPFNSPNFGSWFGSIISAEFWELFKQDIQKSVNLLKSQGVEKIGVAGFCWGGKAATVAASTGHFSAAVSIHGAAHDASDVTNAKCPIFFATIVADQFFPETSHELVVKTIEETNNGGKLKLYDGVQHGFAVRGDYSNDHVRAKADEALLDAIEFVKSHF
eukprot:c11337_g1_i1.p1 GENE.c11337_g1_i1~~c11337_g1_i1.p1  ORF type:complete len:243 (-),score=48.43 c11337_g1_i1:34-762(-)